ncbi:MAG TPA: 1-(5-phosphoribosyl)-5-[(5-phosphoribosylamino)methylideneamino]imidazole-4-carboxamide isomerase [bacterium]|nr:1-(5-phosphoribosyl)-5-[(5-phosphoribosylamino)methylideneamino]imidazole-4-carboxamide isomerase [bacterium]HPQ18254.1 1-(5-phosphoribosyl)-5-[(5-phosphoribosylamino)methylideneamino]imidazole-4-carboxamide isomerase [bacterium]
MFVIPAIDLKDGKCVRLKQGISETAKIYYENPEIIAKIFLENDLKRIHIVDLDGAFTGNQNNFNIIKKIAKLPDIILQVGGGIRNFESADKLFEIGVSNIIIGTIAITDKKEFNKILNKFCEKIFVSIDAYKLLITLKGWVEKTQLNAISVIQQLANSGIKTFIYTNIEKDGMLCGPDISSALEILDKVKNISLILSGGVSSETDIENVYKYKDKGISGLIVGKAIYEKKVEINNLKKFY